MAGRKPKKIIKDGVVFDPATGISIKMRTPIGVTKNPSLLKADPTAPRRSKRIVSEEFKKRFGRK